MSTYQAEIQWSRAGRRFVGGDYSRAHTWKFDGGAAVPASASPHVVPLPNSVAANVDPEEAFVAAISSCHMLFFLSLAAKRRIVVDEYIDMAAGYLEKDENGSMAMTRVILRPRIRYGGEAPARDTEAALHHDSHAQCFIANSVKTRIDVEMP